ncbi:hypothetical protein EDD22DRAFT_919830 [Suillus occidentalis]|nr:hypothetical protein EDD22DRAFT_919830 [Suillus occidentalis]
MVCAGLDGFTQSSEYDKASLLRMLKESGSLFPPEFVSYCVLPCLTSTLELGGASAATIVPLVLQFGQNSHTQRLWLDHRCTPHQALCKC